MVASLAFDFVMKLVSKAEMAAVSGVEGLGSLHAWLGQELEIRGIDAVIYTRYILSILQQDSFVPDDLDLAADNHFFPPNRKDAQRGRSTFRNSRKSEKRRPVEITDCEERKKSAAVECLLSLSDEDSGIESLVEEIYSKLKEQQANHAAAETNDTSSQPDVATNQESDASDPAAGPAERYYAAFPALTTETEGSVAPSVAAKGGIWAAKVTQGLARNDSGRLSAMTRLATSDIGEEQECDVSSGEEGCKIKENGDNCEQKNHCRPSFDPSLTRRHDSELPKEDHTLEYQYFKRKEMSTSFPNKTVGESGFKSNSKCSRMPVRNSKAWKEYEYMKPIFIIPKAPSPDVNMQRVRSVRTNQKTESVLDFFFKSRVALASPLLDEMCFCGAESVWRCTSGCLSWPEMLGLEADSEDQSWYTEPLDMMVRPSPLPSRRLYNRRSVFGSLTNWALYGNNYSYQDDQNGLHDLGLTTLLSRTLNQCASDVNDNSLSSNDIFLPQDLDSSENEENDTSSETTSEVSSEIYQITSEGDGIYQRCSPDETELIEAESDEEEVAYPSHITLKTLKKAKPLENICAPPSVLPADANEEGGGNTCGFLSGEASPIGSPVSQVPWETPELLSQERSVPSSPVQTTLVEGLWDIPSGQRSSYSEDGKTEEPVMHQDIESIWNGTQLSPTLVDSNEVFLNVNEDNKWGHCSSPPKLLEANNNASSSFSARHSTLKASEKEIEAKAAFHPHNNIAPVLSGNYGLGSGVWESCPTSPCATQGRLSTPSSSENEVLDDRPYFIMPLNNNNHHHNQLLNNDIEQDSPIPIPPIEFNFSDSEDEDHFDIPHLNNNKQLHHHHPSDQHQQHDHQHDDQKHDHASCSSPHHHHHHRQASTSPTSLYLPHSHSHSCIENMSHLDIWKDHDATNTTSVSTEVARPELFREEGQGSTSTSTTSNMVGGEEHRGIMASLTCDTFESGSRWSQCSPLTDMLLTTSLPMFLDNSNVWSYCLEKVFPPKADRSPLEGDWPDKYTIHDPWRAFTLPLSPIHGGSDLSHLWDINAVHRSDWKSDMGTIGMETQNIRRYLMNLRFEIPDQETRCKIIDGGLYGTLLTPGSWTVREHNSPTWSMWKCSSPQLQSLASSDVFTSLPVASSQLDHQLDSGADGDKLWHNFSAKPQFFRQRSTSADNADTMVSEGGSPVFRRRHQLLGSTDLLPSENSAFCDIIPPRLPHLPHVQSEPTLDLERLHGRHVYNHGRLVQVRSLYKSDTSILHQLGLATAEEGQPQTEIEVQPHTHFVPISSDPVPKEAAAGDTVKPETSNGSQYIPTPSGPVPNVCPVLGRDSSYQLYYNEERDEDDSGSSPEVFVPRFQVQKDTEKWCQTGESSAITTPECTPVHEDLESEEPAFREESVGTLSGLIPRCISEPLVVIDEVPVLQHEIEELEDEEAEALDVPGDIGAEGGEIASHENENEQKEIKEQDTLGIFLYDIQDVLELSVEDAERFINGDVEHHGWEEQKDDVEYSSDYESMGGEQVSVEELGRSGIAELWDDDGDDVKRDPSVTPVPILVPAPSPSIPIATGGAGSTVSNYRSIWSWGADPELPSLPDNFTSTPHTSFIGAESGLSSSFDGSTSAHVPWSCAETDVIGFPHIGEGHSQGLYAMGDDRDADQQWLDDNDVFIDDPDVQMQLIGVDPNPEPDKLLFSSDLEEHWLSTESSFTVQVPNKKLASDRKKPCSFFLEGNCRRTDCKYAHDISNITCRFWEEGDCFKGVTCPFLHGYAEGIHHGSSQRSSSERDFSLEEEEFPELSTSQDETGSYIRNAIPARRRTSSRKFEDRPLRNSSDNGERRQKGDAEKRSRKPGSAPSRPSIKANGNKHKDSAEKKMAKKFPKE